MALILLNHFFSSGWNFYQIGSSVKSLEPIEIHNPTDASMSTQQHIDEVGHILDSHHVVA